MLIEYTLETKLKEWSGPYSEYHSQGWPIVAKFYDIKDHRVHVVCKRVHKVGSLTLTDYAVGIGYDVTEGSWGQGWYDYTTCTDAIDALKQKYKVVEVK